MKFQRLNIYIYIYIYLIICHFIRLSRTIGVQQSCLQAFKIEGDKITVLHNKPTCRVIAYLAAE